MSFVWALERYWCIEDTMLNLEMIMLAQKFCRHNQLRWSKEDGLFKVIFNKDWSDDLCEGPLAEENSALFSFDVRMFTQFAEFVGDPCPKIYLKVKKNHSIL